MTRKGRFYADPRQASVVPFAGEKLWRFFLLVGLHGASLVLTAQQLELQLAFHIECLGLGGIPGLLEQAFGGTDAIR